MSATGADDETMNNSDNDNAFKKEVLRQLGELSKHVVKLQKDVDELKGLPQQIAQLKELPDDKSIDRDIRHQFAAIHKTQLSIKEKLHDMSCESIPQQQQRRIIQQESIAVEERPATAARVVFVTPGPAILIDRPKDLIELWKEYKFGINGNKPAEQFTQTERNDTNDGLKQKYYRRKVIWDCISNLVRIGYTAENACNMIYSHYGRKKSVSQLVNLMIIDRRNNTFPKKLTGNEIELLNRDEKRVFFNQEEEKTAVAAETAQDVVTTTTSPNNAEAEAPDNNNNNIEEDDDDDVEVGSATLTKHPRDLIELWYEYKFGIGGRKPAEQFTSIERNDRTNGLKQKYYRRKVIWDCISRLVRAGYTPEGACTLILTHYGPGCSITKIINQMINDRARNTLPELLR